MPKKNQQEQPVEFVPEQFDGNVATEPDPAPAVKLGQHVRYALAGGKNAGAVRLATVVAIRDDGSPTLNVMLGHKDDLNVGGKLVGIPVGNTVLPLANYLVDPDGYSAEPKPGTWSLA